MPRSGGAFFLTFQKSPKPVSSIFFAIDLKGKNFGNPFENRHFRHF